MIHINIKRYISLLVNIVFLFISFYFAINEFHQLMEIALIASALAVVVCLVLVKNIHQEYISKISSIIDIGIQYHESEAYSRRSIILQFLILISTYATLCYFAKKLSDTHAFNFIMIQAICGLFIFFLMLDYEVFKIRVRNVNGYLQRHAKKSI